MRLDPARILTLKDRLKGALDIEDLWHPGSIFLEVDDVGLLWMGQRGCNLQPGLLDVHMHFWDNRLRGRESLVREALRVGIYHTGALRLLTSVPHGKRVVDNFVRRIGFREVVSSPTGVAYVIGRVDLLEESWE